MPATVSQIEANRSNAQLSTGPRTAEGKQTSSQNAVTHGMTSKQVVLPHESLADYEAIRDGFLQTWAPANELEHALTVAIADTWWRLQRQRRIETALMNQRMKSVCETNPDFDPDTALAFLMSDPAEMKRMSLMLRYVNSAERAHSRAIRELEQVQKLRSSAASEEEPFDEKAMEKQLETFMLAKIAAETKPGETPQKVSYAEYLTPVIPSASKLDR